MIYILLSVFLLIAFTAIYLLGKETKYGYVLVGIVLILIAAFRDGADMDYGGYVDYYNNIEQETVEPTFHLICYFVKIFFFDNVVFLFFDLCVIRGIIETDSDKATNSLKPAFCCYVYIILLYIA